MHAADSFCLICFKVGPNPADVTLLGDMHSFLAGKLTQAPVDCMLVLTLALPMRLSLGDRIESEFMELSEYSFSTEEPLYFRKKRKSPSPAEQSNLQDKAHVALIAAASASRLGS